MNGVYIRRRNGQSIIIQNGHSKIVLLKRQRKSKFIYYHSGKFSLLQTVVIHVEAGLSGALTIYTSSLP